jgi:hypothetical protein
MFFGWKFIGNNKHRETTLINFKRITRKGTCNLIPPNLKIILDHD